MRPCRHAATLGTGCAPGRYAEPPPEPKPKPKQSQSPDSVSTAASIAVALTGRLLRRPCRPCRGIFRTAGTEFPKPRGEHVIDLYTASTPNGWKVSVMLEEIGMPYTVRPISLKKGEQKLPEFLALNPETVAFPPSSIAATMTSRFSRAARSCSTSARRAASCFPATTRAATSKGPVADVPDERRRTDDGPGECLLYRYFPEKLPSAIARYHNEGRRLFEVLNGQLRGREYLCDEVQPGGHRQLVLGADSQVERHRCRRPR